MPKRNLVLSILSIAILIGVQLGCAAWAATPSALSHLISSQSQLAVLLYDGAKVCLVGIWDVQAMKYRQIEVTQVPTMFSGGWPNMIGFSPNGNYLAIEKVMTKGQNYMLPQPFYKSEVEIWDVQEEKFTVDCKIRGRVPVCISNSKVVATIPHQLTLVELLRQFVYEDTRIELVDAQTGKVVAHCQPDKNRYLQSYTFYGRSGRFSPDGHQLAIAVSVSAGKNMESHDELRVYDAHTGKLSLTLPGSSIFCFSEDGKTLVTFSTKDGICAWEVSSGKQIWSKQGYQALGSQAIATGGDRVVAFGKLNQDSAEKAIHVFNLTTGEMICTIKEAEEPVALQLTDHGAKLVTAAHPYFKPIALETYDVDSGKATGAQSVFCDEIEQAWHLAP